MLRALLRLTLVPSVLLAALLTALRILGERALAARHEAAFAVLTLGTLALAAVLFGVVLRRAGERWAGASAMLNAVGTALYLGGWVVQRAAGWAAAPPPALLPSLLMIALCAPTGVMVASGVRSAMLRMRLIQSSGAAESSPARRVT